MGGGKGYYEAIVTDEGLCRVGWSTGHASLELGRSNGGTIIIYIETACIKWAVCCNFA